MRPQDLGFYQENILLLMSFILLMSFYLAFMLPSLLNISNGTIITDVKTL